MAQINETSKSSEDHAGDELLSSEEWMIIGDKESSDNISVDSSKENNKIDNSTGDNDDNNDDDDDEDDEKSTAEVAREAIQVLGDQESDRNFGGEESLIPETLIAGQFPALKDDDSDGISVITESERNDDSICKCITEIVNTKDNVFLTPATCIHIVIACLLAVSIGFGIGWYVSLEKPQMPTNDVNFKPAKNGKLLNDMNKLNLDDSLVILNSNPELASVVSKHILNGVQKPIMNDKNLNENFVLGDILKNVNIFIDTLCTMIDNMNFDSTGLNYRCNYTAFNLMSLKNNIESINMLSKLTEENPNPRFQDNMKSRIDDVSVSFVNDLSRSIESSVRKMNQKLNKMKYKLHHKVCLMQNAMKNNLDGMKQIKDLGINCTFEFEKHGANFELKTKGEKRNLKKPEKVYSHPIGPDVKQKANYKNKKVDSNIYPDNKQLNERIIKSPEENKGSKQYKKRKMEKKYNDKNSSEYSELKVSDYIDEDLEKSIQDTSQMKYHKNEDDWKKYAKRDYENTCHTKPCMNQKNKDRKYSQERSNGNWQFKRSEGRDNWRTEKKADVETISWDHERSKARESARLKY
ncbi:uncharacterized protein [Chelonus insularis]|uniref:uncharacterized protein n=1 Tax=Chelonus insularis TaxID=460826 RepID=UPI00158DFD9B|nr:uncharacterized protein LOC118064651 [Chelonus insularis]XP_034935297.1 uncharacterized protein LOC118064651 [Chelonus insularis]XP_034935298.1 uncharacterized protein LOC118064651 [Chelonus insularis]